METYTQISTKENECKFVETEFEVILLSVSESRIIFRHGGEIIKSDTTYVDFFGYLTSCNRSRELVQLAQKYSISTESTLELELETSVYLQPVIETDESKKFNALNTGGNAKMYRHIPQNWLVKDPAQGMYRKIERYLQDVSVVWSSKRPEKENDLQIKKFKEQWASPNAFHKECVSQV